jgi:hypothetical protein
VGARKRVDLLSIAGATLAGAAVGALLARTVLPLAYPLLGVGLVAHGIGMRARHRIDSSEGPLSRGWRVLYAVCWIAIGALLVAAFVQRFS